VRGAGVQWDGGCQERDELQGAGRGGARARPGLSSRRVRGSQGRGGGGGGAARRGSRSQRNVAADFLDGLGDMVVDAFDGR
jgi:hypothetical protein